MSNFMEGDVVRLKSGGPSMVVRRKEVIEKYVDRVHVTWFKPDGSVANDYFNSVILEHVGEGQ